MLLLIFSPNCFPISFNLFAFSLMSHIWWGTEAWSTNLTIVHCIPEFPLACQMPVLRFNLSLTWRGWTRVSSLLPLQSLSERSQWGMLRSGITCTENSSYTVLMTILDGIPWCLSSSPIPYLCWLCQRGFRKIKCMYTVQWWLPFKWTDCLQLFWMLQF